MVLAFTQKLVHIYTYHLHFKLFIVLIFSANVTDRGGRIGGGVPFYEEDLIYTVLIHHYFSSTMLYSCIVILLQACFTTEQ